MNIVLAWKNALYQETFSKEQRVLVPENSVGMLNLTDEDLANVQGADGGPGLDGTAAGAIGSSINVVTGLVGNTTGLLGNTTTGLLGNTIGLVGNTTGLVGNTTTGLLGNNSGN